MQRKLLRLQAAILLFYESVNLTNAVSHQRLGFVDIADHKYL